MFDTLTRGKVCSLVKVELVETGSGGYPPHPLRCSCSSPYPIFTYIEDMILGLPQTLSTFAFASLLQTIQSIAFTGQDIYWRYSCINTCCPIEYSSVISFRRSSFLRSSTILTMLIKTSAVQTVDLISTPLPTMFVAWKCQTPDLYVTQSTRLDLHLFRLNLYSVTKVPNTFS